MRFRVAAVMTTLALSVSACGDDGCGNRLIEARQSPDNSLTAYHYVRDCGATTGFASVVAIGTRNAGISNAEPAFIADHDHGKALLDTSGVIWTQVAWTGPRSVSVAHARDARIFKKEARVAGVRLSYRTASPVVRPNVD